MRISVFLQFSLVACMSLIQRSQTIARSACWLDCSPTVVRKEAWFMATAETATQSPGVTLTTDHSDWLQRSARKQNTDAVAE